jgi:hypothetical protein
MKGFLEEWCALIHNFVSGGSSSIRINDDIVDTPNKKKTLIQGDPLLSIIFNIVLDMLDAMIVRVKIDAKFRD